MDAAAREPRPATPEAAKSPRLTALQNQHEQLGRDVAGLQARLKRLDVAARQLDIVAGYLASTDPQPDEPILADADASPAAMTLRVIQAQEGERQRLAEEVHDGPAQVLTNAIFQVEYLDRVIDDSPDAARAELAFLRSMLRDGLDEVRSFITNLRPPAVDVGLNQAIAAQAGEFQLRHGIDVQVSVQGIDDRLDPGGKQSVPPHPPGGAPERAQARRRDPGQHRPQGKPIGHQRQRTGLRRDASCIRREPQFRPPVHARARGADGRPTADRVQAGRGDTDPPSPPELGDKEIEMATTLSKTNRAPKQEETMEEAQERRRGADRRGITKSRIVIVDGHTLFRRGVRNILELEADIEVVGEAGTGREALAVVEETTPDVVLMDLGLPAPNGIETTQRIKRELPHTGVIVLASNDDEDQLFDAIKAGAAAYVLKDIDPTDLIAIIRRVRAGEYLINDKVFSKPAVASRVLKEFRELAVYGSDAQPIFAPLSPREVEILDNIAQGMTNKQVAYALSISEQTVKNHMSSILRKLSVNDRTQAVVYAMRQGWIKIPED